MRCDHHGDTVQYEMLHCPQSPAQVVQNPLLMLCLSLGNKHSGSSHAIFIITLEQRREVRTSLQCSTRGVESIKKSASNAHARAMSHLVMQMRFRCADETITALEALKLLLNCY